MHVPVSAAADTEFETNRRLTQAPLQSLPVVATAFHVQLGKRFL
jgi:hypothetical protein